MADAELAVLRRFNRTLTERIGALNDEYLSRSRPLGASRVLWEVGSDGDRTHRLASFDATPVSLAQDSASGTADGRLVDVGAGTEPGDYDDVDVEGAFVLNGRVSGGLPSARRAPRRGFG